MAFSVVAASSLTSCIRANADDNNINGNKIDDEEIRWRDQRISFANAWAAVTRNGGGGGGVPLPKFDAAAYFSPVNISGFQPPSGMVEEGVATCRIFTFPATTIAALREKYTAGGGRRPSRVEALSAFIWTRFVSAAGLTSDPKKMCSVRSAVNLRTRADLQLSEYDFGNLLGAVEAKPAAGDGGVEFLEKLREGVKAVDGLVAGMKKGGEYLKEMMMAEVNKAEPVSFDFSSLTGFPLYEVDFGWGRPDWVGIGPLHHRNLAMLVNDRSGDGIEAIIYLTKQDMEKFEAHFKLASNVEE